MDFEQISPINYEWIFSKTRTTPTLKQLALDQIIQNLWRYTLNRSSREGILIDFLEKHAVYDACIDLRHHSVKITLQNRASEIINQTNPKISLSESSKIQIIIQRRFFALQLNTIKWFDYHHRLLRVFYGDSFADSMYIFDRFDQFVFDVHDDIDYTKTVREMISSDKFTDIDKFIFACNYCFEKDIKTLWPSVRWDISKVVYNQSNQFDRDILRYWVDRMHGLGCEALVYQMCCHNGSSMYWLFWQSDFTPTCVWAILLTFLEFPSSLFSFDEDIITRRALLLIRYILPRFRAEFIEIDLVPYSTWKFAMIWCMNNETMWQFVMPIWIRIRHVTKNETFVGIFEHDYKIKTSSCNAFKVHPQKLMERYQCEAITDEFLKNTARQIRREVWDAASPRMKEFALNHFRKYKALCKLDFL